MTEPKSTIIKVLGLGGGGSNAVNRMIELGVEGVEFIAANTDAQALRQSAAPTRLHLGPQRTRGLGAGGDPNLGAAAAEESREEIRQALAGADLVFLTAGMGGGTGTGAIPVAAEVARSVGALTVAIVTTPFQFEAARRGLNAQDGLARLRPKVDTLITVPNDRLLQLLSRNTRMDMALRVADEVLRQAVQGLAELIGRAGLINVDFAHVRALMQLPGGALMAMGHGKGEAKAQAAVRQALRMPLIENASIEGANGVLVHFTGGDDLGLIEVSQAAEAIHQAAPEAEIVFGATIDRVMNGRAQVIVIATGLSPRAPTAAAEVKNVLARLKTAPLEPAAAEPAPPLADVFFQKAGGPPAVPEAPWVNTNAPAANPQNLDVPAFLRRRRSLRDFEGGK